MAKKGKEYFEKPVIHLCPTLVTQKGNKYYLWEMILCVLGTMVIIHVCNGHLFLKVTVQIIPRDAVWN